MATITICDRCGSTDVQESGNVYNLPVTPVEDGDPAWANVELCRGCITDLARFMRATPGMFADVTLSR